MFQNKWNDLYFFLAQACQRRGADLTERLSVVFQNIFDTIGVLEPIRTIKFDRIQKATLDEIKANINNLFYSNNETS